MRPVEWLLEMTQSERGYSDLLDQAGGLAAAAWRLARAKCEVREHATDVPTRLEVKAAARELSRRLGLGEVPPSAVLRRDCEALGLLVL